MSFRDKGSLKLPSLCKMHKFSKLDQAYSSTHVSDTWNQDEWCIKYKGGDVHIVFCLVVWQGRQGIGVAGHEWIGWLPLHSMRIRLRRGEQDCPLFVFEMTWNLY